MPLLKDQATQRKEIYAACQSAYAAFEAGEPGAEDKVKEAEERRKKHEQEDRDPDGQNASSATGDGSPLLDADNNTRLPVPPGEGSAGDMVDQPDEDTEVDQAYGGSLQEQFSAMQSRQSQLEQQFSATRQELLSQKKINSALLGKQLRQDFSSYMATKQKDGHQFDAGAMMEMFMTVASNPAAVKSIKRVIETSPKATALDAGNGPTFAGDGNTPVDTFAANSGAVKAPATNSAAAVKETLALLNKAMPGMNFSAEDVHLGSTVSPL